MSIVFSLLSGLVVFGLLLAGIAEFLARTPHGRIKRRFALFFGLARLRGGKRAEGVIDATEMVDAASIRATRAEFLREVAPLAKLEPFDGEIEDRNLEGPGGPLPVRIYRPRGAKDLPLLVYFHGGGFVVGHPDYTETVTRGIAAQAPAVVLSVDYRMAPEHPYPAAVEDVDFVVEWAFANASSLGARSGPVAVAGDSAGGNLAAVASLHDAASRAGRIGLQLLVYPCVDVTRDDRPSQVAFARGYGLSRRDCDDCFAAYVPEHVAKDDPSISPLHAPSFEGVCRAVVFTAGFDVLRDEGLEYADTLEKAGVEVRRVHRSDLPHGYITMTRLIREARDDVAIMASEVAALGA
ncbi:MAG: alpha/beta hydrolase [Myxococcota bacterium]